MAKATRTINTEMKAFDLDQLEAERAQAGKRYLEFLRVADLSLGLYFLPAGEVDGQQPHSEDEAYYVVRGRANVQVAEEDRPVGPGSIVFVPAGVEHRFHHIEEDLSLIVVFGPAEGSRA